MSPPNIFSDFAVKEPDYQMLCRKWTNKNYYEILGLSLSFNGEINATLKKEYHDFLLKYHPDHIVKLGLSDDIKIIISDIVKVVIAAYDTLSDKEKRKQYKPPTPSFRYSQPTPSSKNQPSSYGAMPKCAETIWEKFLTLTNIQQIERYAKINSEYINNSLPALHLENTRFTFILHNALTWAAIQKKETHVKVLLQNGSIIKLGGLSSYEKRIALDTIKTVYATLSKYEKISVEVALKKHTTLKTPDLIELVFLDLFTIDFIISLKRTNEWDLFIKADMLQELCLRGEITLLKKYNAQLIPTDTVPSVFGLQDLFFKIGSSPTLTDKLSAEIITFLLQSHQLKIDINGEGTEFGAYPGHTLLSNVACRENKLLTIAALIQHAAQEGFQLPDKWKKDIPVSRLWKISILSFLFMEIEAYRKTAQSLGKKITSMQLMPGIAEDILKDAKPGHFIIHYASADKQNACILSYVTGDNTIKSIPLSTDISQLQQLVEIELKEPCLSDGSAYLLSTMTQLAVGDRTDPDILIHYFLEESSLDVNAIKKCPTKSTMMKLWIAKQSISTAVKDNQEATIALGIAWRSMLTIANFMALTDKEACFALATLVKSVEGSLTPDKFQQVKLTAITTLLAQGLYLTFDEYFQIIPVDSIAAAILLEDEKSGTYIIHPTISAHNQISYVTENGQVREVNLKAEGSRRLKKVSLKTQKPVPLESLFKQDFMGYGTTILHIVGKAAEQNRPNPILDELLTHQELARKIINSQNDCGQTPLHMIVGRCCMDLACQTMLKLGADPTIKSYDSLDLFAHDRFKTPVDLDDLDQLGVVKTWQAFLSLDNNEEIKTFITTHKQKLEYPLPHSFDIKGHGIEGSRNYTILAWVALLNKPEHAQALIAAGAIQNFSKLDSGEQEAIIRFINLLPKPAPRPASPLSLLFRTATTPTTKASAVLTEFITRYQTQANPDTSVGALNLAIANREEIADQELHVANQMSLNLAFAIGDRNLVEKLMLRGIKVNQQTANLAVLTEDKALIASALRNGEMALGISEEVLTQCSDQTRQEVVQHQQDSEFQESILTSLVKPSP